MAVHMCAFLDFHPRACVMRRFRRDRTCEIMFRYAGEILTTTAGGFIGMLFCEFSISIRNLNEIHAMLETP
jgi:hypothetical protein